MDLDIEALRSGLAAVKDVFGLLKSAKDALPESTDTAALEQALLEVEKAAKIADVQIAKSLGYNLCQCTFPPQIMLREGLEVRHAYVCQGCGRRDERGKPLNFQPQTLP